MAEKKNIIWTTGRRKTAVARVRMLPGTGTITVNSRTLEDYFPRPTSRMRKASRYSPIRRTAPVWRS